jgi:hypothetical protein
VEQVLFLRRDTRLSMLCLMLDLYNNPDFANNPSVYNKKGEFQYIEKCAIKFNLIENIGDAAYFDVNLAYRILTNEKEVVKFFFRDIIKYQAYVKCYRSVNYRAPDYDADKIVEKIGKSLSFDGFIKIDPLEKDRLPKIVIYNIDDSNSSTPNIKSNDVFYKDL